jgi:septum formation protein
MTPRRTFVLASASPARLKMLRAAGLDPQVIVSGIDESTVESASAHTLALTLARLKAEAVVQRIRVHGPRPEGAVVLGCDSVLEFGGVMHGKPADAAEAVARWRRLRGGSGVLQTGHCLIDVETGAVAEAVAATTVRFADLTDAEIEAYVATGEPLHVAGGFTIDGLGGWFVEGIEGDHGNVIGVSLPLLRRLLGEVGITIAELWATAAMASST